MDDFINVNRYKKINLINFKRVILIASLSDLELLYKRECELSPISL